MRSVGIAPDVQAVWARSWITPWGWPMLVLFNIFYGFVLIAGDPDRISNPAFDTVRPIGDDNLGLIFVILGLGMGISAFVSRRALRWATTLATIAHALLWAGFVVAWLNEPPSPAILGCYSMPPPRAALTGIPSYLLITGVHFANAMLYGRTGPQSTSPSGEAGDGA